MSVLFAAPASDLAPGQRVRMMRGAPLETIVATHAFRAAPCRVIIRTDRSSYVRDRTDLVDTESLDEDCPATMPSNALPSPLAAVTRNDLRHALRTCATLGALRTAVIMIADALDGTDEDAPPTERAPVGYPTPWEGDAAPPTPRPTAEGDEW